MAKAKVRKYARAPITEAVIEIRLRTGATEKQLEKVVRRLGASYPRKEEVLQRHFQIDATGGNVSVAEKPGGFRLTSDDQADIVVLQSHSITVARLAPYDTWNAFRDAAKTVWTTWRKFNAARPVERLGIRYINRVDIPFGGKPNLRLEDFFHFYPKLPDIGESTLLKYTMQVDMPTDMPMWQARLTSTIVDPPPLLDHLSILLDIDVFRTQDIPQNDERLWPAIEEARRVKNQIFELCITDQSRKLFTDE